VEEAVFYTLARAPDEITLLDILLAVDGDKPMFRCTEIRQKGPCASKPADCKAPCNIAAGFWRAQEAYRQSLSEIDLVTLSRSVAAQLGMEKVMQAGAWIGEHVRSRN
jgi:DNA-binding IscR family transcriptional regulator